MEQVEGRCIEFLLEDTISIACMYVLRRGWEGVGLLQKTNLEQ